MSSHTAQADEHRDPRDGTASVRPVTGEMMDHAARAAAALADGVAHGDKQADGVAHGDKRIERVVADAAGAAGMGMAAAAEAVGTAERAATDAATEATEAAARTAEAAAGAPEGTADALARYNAKVMELAQANMASTTALFAALAQARSVPEALAINADHLRRQMESLTSQGRELATMAQAIALDALQPLKGRPGH